MEPLFPFGLEGGKRVFCTAANFVGNEFPWFFIFSRDLLE